MIAVPDHLKEQVEQRIKQCAHLTKTHIRRLKIDYDLTTASTIGEAEYSWTNRIRLNPVYLLDQPEHYIEHIVAHEYAHLVAYRRAGLDIRPHGKEWKAVMTTIGIDPSRCYEYDVPAGYTVNSRQRFVKL